MQCTIATVCQIPQPGLWKVRSETPCRPKCSCVFMQKSCARQSNKSEKRIHNTHFGSQYRRMHMCTHASLRMKLGHVKSCRSYRQSCLQTDTLADMHTEMQTCIHQDRHADISTCGQICRHGDKQKCAQTCIHQDRHADTPTDMQTEMRANMHTCRETCRQADMHTCMHAHMQTGIST